MYSDGLMAFLIVSEWNGIIFIHDVLHVNIYLQLL